MQYEVYVDCAARTVEMAKRFLDRFLPSRSQTSEDYVYPELSDDSKCIFSNVDELIEKLVAEPSEGYGIYWDREGDGDPFQAMLFFTEDGGLIAGLATKSPNTADVLQSLSEAVGGRFGVAVHEEPPPDLMSEFIQKCRLSTTARLVDGAILGL